MKVIMIAAISADGFISPSESLRSFDWTSPEDRQLVIRLSKEMGTIVMGSTTYKTFRIKRAPPGRRLIIYTSKAESIDGENIETTNEAPAALVKRLRDEGTQGLIVEGGSTIYRQFLADQLVDELYLTVEPHLFGTGIPFIDSELHVALQLLQCSQLNDNTVLLHYKLIRTS